MSEINSFLESVDVSKLTTTQKRTIGELYRLTADLVTEIYRYDSETGAKVYEAIISDIDAFGDFVGNNDSISSSIDEYKQVEYKTVETPKDYDKVLPVNPEDTSVNEVTTEIIRQFPGLQSTSNTESDTQEDTDNDTQEDTTEEEQTTQDSSVQVIDAETLQEEVKQFGDVSENSLKELHEQIGDFRVTSQTFETSITDEYDSFGEVVADPNKDANELTQEQIDELSA